MLRGFLVLVALCAGSSALAADPASKPAFELYAQADGDTVKLIWKPNRWLAGLQGFNVRRRAPGGAWQTLNTALMVPTVRDSDFATRSNDPAVVASLPAMRDKMIADKNISDLPFEEMRAKFLEDKGGIAFLSFVLAMEYRGALVLGFAYQDTKVPKAVTYEYGLFGVIDGVETADPLSRQTVKWGSRPTVSVAFGEPEVSGYEGSKGIWISWPVDPTGLAERNIRFKQMKRDAAGRTEQVGETAAGTANGKTSATFGKFDFPHEPATIWLVPVDMFNTEGKPSKEVKYDKQAYPEGTRATARPAAAAAPAAPATSAAPATPAASSPPEGIVFNDWIATLLPPAEDAAEAALANYPALRGGSNPEAKNCAPAGQPGDPKYCLQPARNMQVWLRADDFSSRYKIISLWENPKPLRNWAKAGAQSGEHGWFLANQVAGSPAIRFAERSSLELNGRVQSREFTLFVVGRQIPGSSRGVILTTGGDDPKTIEWRNGEGLFIGSGEDGFNYEGVNQYHILAVRFMGGQANVIANNKGVMFMPVDFPEEPQLRYVGKAPSGAGADTPGATDNPLAAFRATTAALTPPQNPAEGVDIAEIIIWPRGISNQDMQATQRYLRKKYSLP